MRDCWYGWAVGQWQLHNLNGLTAGNVAIGDPVVASVSNKQWHISYRDAAGIIWDWYEGAFGLWHLQQINLNGLTAGNAAVGDPFGWSWYTDWHITYRDAAGIIWDSMYDGANWNLAPFNLNGLTARYAATRN